MRRGHARIAFGVLRLGARVVGLLGRVGVLALRLRWYRRKALHGFARGLREAGVPEHLIAPLLPGYPDPIAAFRERERG